jgi:hypothetical protein
MARGIGDETTVWNPVVYRSDGAWIGVMPDGRIGVGVEEEGRAALETTGFVPHVALPGA